MATKTRTFAILLGLMIAGLVLFRYFENKHKHYAARTTDGKLRQLRSCRPEFDSTTKWVQPKIPERLLNASQDDPELIEHVCNEWLLPPSTKHRRLKRPTARHYSASNQSVLVDRVLGARTGGFFIECGAADGESLSNSLFFEKSRNWTGLLVEGYLPWYRKLLRLRRHAYSVGACLSAEKRPVVTNFTNIGYGGGLIDRMERSHLDRFGGKARLLRSTEAMQCLPLYSILRAIGVKHVDYFSLDIEGAELDVIRTLPLGEITVDVFTIEYIVGDVAKGRADSDAKLSAITDYLVGRHDYEVFHVNKVDDVFLKRKTLR